MDDFVEHHISFRPLSPTEIRVMFDEFRSEWHENDKASGFYCNRDLIIRHLDELQGVCDKYEQLIGYYLPQVLLWVKPERQLEGYGTAVVRKLQLDILGAGDNHHGLLATEEAKSFYERMGYSPVRGSQDFFMSKVLDAAEFHVEYGEMWYTSQCGSVFKKNDKITEMFLEKLREHPLLHEFKMLHCSEGGFGTPDECHQVRFCEHTGRGHFLRIKSVSLDKVYALRDVMKEESFAVRLKMTSFKYRRVLSE